MSTRAQILAEIAAQFPDNTTGLITPAKLRQVVEDVTNSCLVSDTDAGTAGIAVLQAETAAQGRTALGIAGDASNAMVAPYYVDSVGGNDTNSGRTAAAPLKTIAALRAKGIVDGDRIFLKRGSYFREALDLYNKSSLLIADYGAGAPWTIDGSDNIANAGFTVNGTYSTIYQIAYTVPTAIGACTFAVWENDSALRPFTSLATLDGSATGGFYAAGGVLYIKATDAGNVITNGKTYSAHGPRDYANFGCFNFRCHNNCEVRGGRVIKPYVNDGAGIGNDSYVHDMVFEQGTKHNAVIGGGVLQRCEFKNIIDPSLYVNSSHIAFYFNANLVSWPVIDDCVFSNPVAYGANSAILGHTDGGGSISGYTVTNCRFKNIANIFGLSSPQCNFYRNILEDCGRVVELFAGSVFKSVGNYIFGSYTGSVFSINASDSSSRVVFTSNGDRLVSPTGSNRGAFITALSGASYFSITVSDLYSWRGETSNGNPVIALNGTSAGCSIKLLNCEIHDKYIINGLAATADISAYVGSGNRIAANAVYLWNSTNYAGLKAWKAATGSDATSSVIAKAPRSYPVAVTIPSTAAGTTAIFTVPVTGITNKDRLTYKIADSYVNYPSPLNIEMIPGGNDNTVEIRAANLSSSGWTSASVNFVIYADSFE